eukprot:365276-Chlamydomonas_euryale.AAC.16
MGTLLQPAHSCLRPRRRRVRLAGAALSSHGFTDFGQAACAPTACLPMGVWDQASGSWISDRVQGSTGVAAACSSWQPSWKWAPASLRGLGPIGSPQGPQSWITSAGQQTYCCGMQQLAALLGMDSCLVCGAAWSPHGEHGGPHSCTTLTRRWRALTRSCEVLWRCVAQILSRHARGLQCSTEPSQVAHRAGCCRRPASVGSPTGAVELLSLFVAIARRMFAMHTARRRTGRVHTNVDSEPEEPRMHAHAHACATTPRSAPPHSTGRPSSPNAPAARHPRGRRSRQPLGSRNSGLKAAGQSRWRRRQVATTPALALGTRRPGTGLRGLPGATLATRALARARRVAQPTGAFLSRARRECGRGSLSGESRRRAEPMSNAASATRKPQPRPVAPAGVDPADRCVCSTNKASAARSPAPESPRPEDAVPLSPARADPALSQGLSRSAHGGLRKATAHHSHGSEDLPPDAAG